jgi:hypothetical protein
MAGLRAGRAWVDHGHLVDGIDVRLGHEGAPGTRTRRTPDTRDGRRNGPGPLGSAVDPHGPLPHPPGDGDPA